ncbi:DNA-binding response regulator [Halopseudomonas pachastrellae]|uniref:DNA-binding response regulator n=1 Tax=Halopseudomonas pachastrellae TaxID=254161 RepID=A0A1S8DBH4_9GAMM|nr:sigma-54 dependent transcriptional regulator [Halopseudomonas pachastrellae]ONM42785.1 DNA-binding response regulator [Halopseudomonas pachastrellae]SFM05498.1 two-component system, NtrC family, C4-dicarboxylate transport response regulator DctD [Halopseudomonas pachastrellae]
MSEPVIFFIDDDAHIRQAITQTLALEDLPVRAFADGPSALAELTADFPGIILCDYHMPGMDGLAVLQAVRDCDDSIPLIILTGQGDISTAVAAMRNGAYDFIEKPFHHDGLIEIIKRALDKRRLALENRHLKAQVRGLTRPGPRLLGDSASMQTVIGLLEPLLNTSADILLHGETGSGKDAIARYIHENSNRSDHNFVAINCGAVPENLIESELFGHEAGAFTGADKRRIGKFEHANKGTLFLDELESMPLNLQVKLLRVLEERKVERLGSNQPIAVDVRIVAATKSDLKALSDAGEFRSDLYYRLNVVQIKIPPLRERKQDVPLLFHHFALIAASRYDREIIPLDAAQAAALMQHDWPGNVRELRNLAERYVLMGTAALSGPETAQLPAAGGQQTLAEMLDAYEHSLLASALKACNGSIKEVMMQLGLARKTLYDKMKRHGLDKADFKD